MKLCADSHGGGNARVLYGFQPHARSVVGRRRGGRRPILGRIASKPQRMNVPSVRTGPPPLARASSGKGPVWGWESGWAISRRGWRWRGQTSSWSQTTSSACTAWLPRYCIESRIIGTDNRVLLACRSAGGNVEGARRGVGNPARRARRARIAGAVGMEARRSLGRRGRPHSLAVCGGPAGPAGSSGGRSGDEASPRDCSIEL